jgi:hypothetical protein
MKNGKDGKTQPHQNFMIGSQVKIGSMSLQYRIKVEVKNNGEKQYIPQAGTPKLTICKRSVYPWLEWKNLDKHPNSTYRYYNGFTTEQEAEEVIESHKKEVVRIELNKVKSVYYINK